MTTTSDPTTILTSLDQYPAVEITCRTTGPERGRVVHAYLRSAGKSLGTETQRDRPSRRARAVLQAIDVNVTDALVESPV